ncbi:MAG: hypothetical protein KF684_04090 [Phycisphaeraceae bacterium]|nr:hypothetical protein [Phycisphaeraceae bacterium]
MPRQRSREVHGKFGTHIFVRPLSWPQDHRLLDIGVPNAAPQTRNETQNLDSYDQRGGALTLDESDITRFKESITIQTRNQQAEVVAIYSGAAGVDGFTQASGSVADIEYDDIVLGSHRALVDGDGERIFNISAVTVTDDTDPTPVEYEEGNDYIVDAVKGILFIPSDSAIPAGSTIVVTCTAAAMTSYEIKPQTLIKGVEVYAEVWHVAESGTKQRVRTIPRGLLKSAGNAGLGVDVDNFNELILDVLDPGAIVGVLGLGGAPMPTTTS